LSVLFEEKATKDGTPPLLVTREDWERANKDWETVLRKRFTGWEVDMSGDDAMEEAVWPSLKSRLLWALEHPSSTLLPNHKNMIRQGMKEVNASTIKQVFNLLKEGWWLKGVIKLVSISGVETSGSLKDIMQHWADDFQGGTLELWGSRLIREGETFQQAEQKAKNNRVEEAGVDGVEEAVVDGVERRRGGSCCGRR
jgi:hypothetical protein